MEKQVKKVSEEKVWSFNGVHKYVQNTNRKMFQVDQCCQMCIAIIWQQYKRLKKLRKERVEIFFNEKGINEAMLKIKEAIYKNGLNRYLAYD